MSLPLLMSLHKAKTWGAAVSACLKCYLFGRALHPARLDKAHVVQCISVMRFCAWMAPNL